MKTPQFLNRALRVLAALAVAFAIPACSDEDNTGSPSSPGAGANTPLVWNSSSNTGGTGDTSSTSASGDTPLIWSDATYADPNYVPIGIGGAVRFTDIRTYSKPTNYSGLDSGFANHPLRTTTASSSIYIPENYLASLINGHRQTLFGAAGAGGGGAGGGGIPIGNTAGIQLPMHTAGQEVCRAHCHHYAGYLPGVTLPVMNEEGDMLGNTPTPVLLFPMGVPNMATAARGRLGKNGININVNGYADINISGPQWSTPEIVFDEFLNNPILRQQMSAVPGTWSHMAIGHWIGGSQAYYWEVAFLLNPNPAY